MEWKITNDPILTFDTVYTNDSDTPRFVNINIKYYNSGDSSCAFYIDGEEIAEMGRTATPDAQHLYTTQLFVVPSGSTYELKKNSQANISQWWEADMPVAIGTGGKAQEAISFVAQGAGGELTVEPDSVYPWQDTDDGYIKDNKFIAPVTGSYFFSAEIIKSSTPGEVNAGFAVNGEFDAYPWGSTTSPNDLYTVSRVFHLTKGDVVEVKSRVVTVVSGTSYVFMGHSAWSGFLITGQSTGGGSLFNEEVTISLDEPDNSGATDALVIKNSADQSGDGSAIRFLCGQSPYYGAQITAIGRAFNKADLVFTTGSKDAMTITKDGNTFLSGNLTLPADLPESAGVPNMHIGEVSGQIYRSTTTMYSAEEVDKKLAIKDKLIEKLSARLDELEKKVK